MATVVEEKKTLAGTDQPDDQNGISELKNYLDTNIKRLNRQGIWVLVTTIAIGIILYIDIKLSLYSQLSGLDAAKNYNQYLAYLIFRSSALGVIATTILYFGAKITIASFDQATRFTKRKMGALFLEFLYEQHKEQMKGNVDIDQLMFSFEIWNKTVESAFSAVKMEKSDSVTDKVKEKTKGRSKKNNQKKEDADSPKPEEHLTSVQP